jgi:hypothetical protein
MTESQVAEEVARLVAAQTGRGHAIDGNYVSKLERGVITWPNRAYRQAFRTLFNVFNDAELGFYPSRTRKDAERSLTPVDIGTVSVLHAQSWTAMVSAAAGGYPHATSSAGCELPPHSPDSGSVLLRTPMSAGIHLGLLLNKSRDLSIKGRAAAAPTKAPGRDELSGSAYSPAAHIYQYLRNATILLAGSSLRVHSSRFEAAALLSIAAVSAVPEPR